MVLKYYAWKGTRKGVFSMIVKEFRRAVIGWGGGLPRTPGHRRGESVDIDL